MKVIELPAGKGGFIIKLYVLKELIKQGSKHPMIGKIVSRLGSNPLILMKFVNKAIRYRLDNQIVEGKDEVYQRVETILKSRVGDCDCQTILLGSLYERAGLNHGIALYRKGDNYHHIANVVDGIIYDATRNNWGSKKEVEDLTKGEEIDIINFDDFYQGIMAIPNLSVGLKVSRFGGGVRW